MKFSLIPVILSAGFALTQVSAVPLRVVVVTGRITSSSGFVRVGHAAANPYHPFPTANVATMHTVNNMQMKAHHGCAGSLRAKAMAASNWFRHVFGLPAISNDMAKPSIPSEAPAPPSNGTAHILPVGHVNVPVHGGEVGPNVQLHSYQHAAVPHTFVQRLTRALMTLGPWEGRAVSFILGCGIGVLIRMFWVLAVLAIRSFRAKKREEQFVADEVIFEEGERLLPPQYADAYPVEEKSEPIEASA